MDQSPPSEPVSIPANIDLEDKIAWNLTARQLIILGGGLLLLYCAYQASRDHLPLLVFVLLAAPVAAGVIALAVARRDGLALDRYVLVLLRHLAATRRRPEPGAQRRGRGVAVGGLGRGGWWARIRRPVPAVRLPAREVAQGPACAVVDLGAHGLAALAVVSTVSWTLRSTREQDALVAVMARWLHSLSSPVQILVRAVPLDLSGHVDQLDRDAAELGHPALTSAAHDHADFLDWLAAEHQLYRRQIVLVFREPNTPGPATTPAAQARRDRAALNRLGRRLSDAATLLGAAGLTVTALDAEQAATVLATTARPLPTADQPHPTPTDPGDRGGGPDHTHPGDAMPATASHPAGRNAGAAVAAAPPAGYTADPDQGWYPLLPEGWSR
jgi:PrgI family protein